MMLRCFHRFAPIATAFIILGLAPLPAGGQVVVYDPSNYAQNVLQAARALQQINNQIDTAFQRTYPQSYTGSTSSQQLLSDAQTRWQNALVGHHDALRVQAGVVQALDTTRTEIGPLVSSSQSAVGILQATQAGNQLIALQTRQLLDLTALIAAQSRAQSLDGARTTANAEQARVQLDRFLTASRGYQAQAVQMFHQ